MKSNSALKLLWATIVKISSSSTQSKDQQLRSACRLYHYSSDLCLGGLWRPLHLIRSSHASEKKCL